MGSPAKGSPLAALPSTHRRNAFAILLISVVLARSGQVLNFDGMYDALSMKAWRDARRTRREERRRRQMETPLYVPSVIKFVMKAEWIAIRPPSRRKWWIS
jgi:hypothetical protein